MGKVSVLFRIMPSGVDADLVALEAGVREALGDVLRGIAVKPIAFGLKALMASILIDDASGGAEAYEAKLAAVPNVESVETLDVTLV